MKATSGTKVCCRSQLQVRALCGEKPRQQLLVSCPQSGRKSSGGGVLSSLSPLYAVQDKTRGGCIDKLFNLFLPLVPHLENGHNNTS